MNIELAFRKAMASVGFVTDDRIKADGRLHRFHIKWEKAGIINGWYILYGNEMPSGAFGCWMRGISEMWTAKDVSKLSEQERQAYSKRMKQAMAEQEREKNRVHAEARERADRI